MNVRAKRPNEPFAEAPEKGLLKSLLPELRALDRQIEDHHSRLLEDSDALQRLLATPPRDTGLGRLVERRRELVGRMAREALSPKRWVRFGRELLYLRPSTLAGRANTDFELYRLNRRDERWIPRGVYEDPSVTTRRAQYASWRLGNVLALAQTPLWLALLLWLAIRLGEGTLSGWPLLGVVLVASVALAATFTRTRSFLADLLLGAGVPAPFEKMTPGAGSPSPRVRLAEREAKKRAAQARLERVAPQAEEPMSKAHDYHYCRVTNSLAHVMAPPKSRDRDA